MQGRCTAIVGFRAIPATLVTWLSPTIPKCAHRHLVSARRVGPCSPAPSLLAQVRGIERALRRRCCMGDPWSTLPCTQCAQGRAGTAAACRARAMQGLQPTCALLWAGVAFCGELTAELSVDCTVNDALACSPAARSKADQSVPCFSSCPFSRTVQHIERYGHAADCLVCAKEFSFCTRGVHCRCDLLSLHWWPDQCCVCTCTCRYL